MNKKYLQDIYGLKMNPFIEDSAKKIHLQMWADREEQIEEWEKILVNSIETEKNYLSFIIGSYGRGKTLSLFKIEEISENYKRIFPVILNFKSEDRPKAALDFLSRIFRSFNYNEIVRKNSRSRIQKAIDNLDSDFSEPKNIFDAILNKGVSLEKDKINEKNYRQETLIPVGRDKNKSKKVEQTRSNLAFYILSGQINPTKSQLDSFGLLRKINSIDVAKEYLAALLQILHDLGFKSLLILVDEFEYLFSLIPKSQRATYLALLRSLYDFPVSINLNLKKHANMAIFIALSEDGWSSLTEMKEEEEAIGGPTQPLLERLDSTTFLGDFDLEQTEELIKRRLKFNRVKRKFEESPLIPFTKGFVELIYKRTNGVPRDIMTLSGHVLDEGIVSKVDLLTKDFAIKALDEHGF